MTFGEYVKEKRQTKNITLRAFAEKLGIAPAYMSDIEKSKRNAPTQDILDNMVVVLNLTNDEKNELFDLAAQSKDVVAKDLTEYITDNASVRVALRKAKENNIGGDEWIKIIEEMINNKKEN